MMDNRLSHAYLLLSPQADAREEQARRLAQKLVCPGPDAPCGRCRDCRKLLAGAHPDVQFVRRQTDDKGRTRREITVDQIRAVTADAVVAPNEAERKVYILPEADCMNPQAQNALLKALEDPPGHACFILCASSAQALLPTVLSRLVRVREPSRAEGAADETLMPFAREYLALLAGGDRAALALFCMQRAELSGDEALAFVQCVRTLVWRALRGEQPQPGLDRAALFHVNAQTDRAELYLRRNLSARQIFGLLAADPANAMKGTNGN